MKSSKKILWSWALYDFANSLLYTNMVLYFPQWLTKTFGISDLSYNISLTISTLILIATAPYFGSIADRYMNKTTFIRVFSILLALFSLAIPLTYLLFSDGSFILGLILLALFVFINYSYQMSLLFYNALLGDITERAELMKISSFGIAAGWLGAIAGILLILPVASGSFSPVISGPVYAILFASILFVLVVAIPLFVLRDIKPDNFSDPVSDQSMTFVAFLKEVMQNKPIWFFLLGYWLYIDAIITVQENLTLYMQNVFNVPDDKKAIAAIILISGGIIGALASIKLIDIDKPKKRLVPLIIFASLVLFGFVAVPSFNIFLIMLFLLALALGGILATSRAVYTVLIPPRKRGAYFSYYAIAERSGSIIGPLVWGGIVSFSGFASSYQYAMATMGTICLMSILFIRKM